MIEIVPLAQIAPANIEALLDTAFEPERKRRTSYKIRGIEPWLSALSFAALDAEGRLCGQLQCTRVGLRAADGVLHPITFVGPLAVHPTHQGTGVGRALMSALMAAEVSSQPDTDAFAVIGDPDFFERFFGFSANPTADWTVPGPVERHRLLARTSRAEGLPRVAALESLDTPTSSFALERANA